MRLKYWHVSAALLTLDALFCAIIIMRVPYTEIDWIAYMQQISQFRAGERDYSLIKGQTGPLVYPAGHVYLYTALHQVTRAGTHRLAAQGIFAGLYLITIATTLATYRVVKAPLYILPLLILSKRLHSIYLLRLFNDGAEACLMAIATLFYTRKQYALGTLAFTLAVSVKMNALLYVPGIAMILIQGIGVVPSLKHAFAMIQGQILLGLPFLLHDPTSYLSCAFDLKRAFMYRWTVNWRFVPEETFTSTRFAQLLMLAHLVVLVTFAGTRWNRPSRKSLVALFVTSVRTTLGLLFPTGQDRPMAEMTNGFILTTLWTSNLIGVLFARSLHYQFYSWFVCSMPYLLYKTGLPFPLQIVLWAAQEYSWNVYPSTNWSSAVVVAVPLVTLIALWIGTAKDVVGVVVTEESHEAMQKKIRRAKQLSAVVRRS